MKCDQSDKYKTNQRMKTDYLYRKWTKEGTIIPVAERTTKLNAVKSDTKLRFI